MKFLRQSTAAAISFGPAELPADGITLVTTLVSAIDHATTGIKLSKNGGPMTIRHQAVTASTYDSYGQYIVTLDTTDTNTLGRLRMLFAGNAGVFPMKDDFMVLPANVFDSLVSASAFLKIDIAAINTVAADAALLDGNVAGDVIGTISTAVNGAGSATQFSCSDITTAGANHWLGKSVTVKSGTLKGQWWGVVTGYALTGGEGLFTVSPGSPTAQAMVSSDTVCVAS